jgi:dTDP-4-dehydrorhamnose reductase
MSMRILVLGASGMLGSAVFNVLSCNTTDRVYGSVRTSDGMRLFVPDLADRLVHVQDLEDHDQLAQLFNVITPDVVVNCMALGKQDPANPMRSMSMFAILPQRLARLCRLTGARLIQIGSDGVFSGGRGNYSEDDFPDALDVYGTAKFLGEVKEPHAITLRTSIIGPEIQSKNGLLEWFLAQHTDCRAFTRAIFSGFPTNVLAEIIRDVVIPRPQLSGIYHVATPPISKFDLLRLIAQRYGKDIELIPDDKLVMDRSLDATLFFRATGYVPPAWPELIDSMHSYHSNFYRTLCLKIK